MTMFRVIKVTVIGFQDPQPSQRTIWDGEDTNRLSILYPPSEIFGADPLGHSEIDDGLIRTDYRFEKKIQDGTWQECQDPRRRVTPITDLERDIAAENRRLFPGDYEHEEPGDLHDYEYEHEDHYDEDGYEH